MIFCGCAADPRQAATAPPPAADPPGQDPRQAVAPLYIQCRHRQPIPGSRSPGGHGPPTARKEKRIKQFSFDPRQPIHPARIPGRPSRYYIFSAATGSRSPAADPHGQDPRQAVALLYIQCAAVPGIRQLIHGSRSTAGRHGPRAHPGSNPLRGCLYRPRPRVYGSERIAVRSGPAKVL